METRARARPRQRKPNSKPYPEGPPLVLIADANRSNRHLLTVAFDFCHHEVRVHAVSGGGELLAYIDRYRARSKSTARPNIILWGPTMSRPDDQEALNKIKSDPELRKIPVVAVTASSDKQDVLGAYDSGANVHVAQPDSFVGWVSLVETIHEFFFRNGHTDRLF